MSGTVRGAVVVAARRTPIGTAGHAFAALTVDALAASVLAAVAQDVGTLGVPVDDVILGNCLGPGGNVARVAALRAGLGVEVPGVTVDRQCGSGLEALVQAAARVAAGPADLVLAGGAESASTAPWRSWPPVGRATDPVRYARAPFAPVGFPDPEMGPAADAVAERYGVSRSRQDAWAARSHERTLSARAAGRLDREIVAVDGVRVDQRPRTGLSAARLARLRPAFTATGTATAGNSCGVSDGAAVVAVISEEVRARFDLPGLRVVGMSVTAGDPALPGVAPVAAVRSVLKRHDLTVADLEVVEITEAFAAQVIAVSDALGLDEGRVCPDGGAIAMGHPWGASGAVLVVRLFARLLVGDGSGYGLATCAIGGGQAIAVLFQRVR